mmetsp:Transcript_13901/g.19024  ORF Transcript_13901/g.19024 Transcript_13901/m.19024 type:complete len:149 (-) Transcript_13901:112-558(-)
METQIFMLENAMGDRQVKEALDSAAEAMKSIQASIGGVDAVQLQTGLIELSGQSIAPPTTIDIEMDFDDQELEQELEQWTSSGSTAVAKTPPLPSSAGVSESKDEANEDISILSLPKVPKENAAKSTSATRKKAEKTPSTKRLMKPVL